MGGLFCAIVLALWVWRELVWSRRMLRANRIADELGNALRKRVPGYARGDEPTQPTGRLCTTCGRELPQTHAEPKSKG